MPGLNVIHYSRMMSVVASQQHLHILSKFALSSMWNSIEGHPPHITQKHFCTLQCSFGPGIGRISDGWCHLQFTTMLFNTKPPKLWPINTIGWCHSYLQKTYSFAMLIFQGIFNWLLHSCYLSLYLYVTEIYLGSAHLWHYAKKPFHTPALQLSSWQFQNLESQSPFHFQNQPF